MSVRSSLTPILAFALLLGGCDRGGGEPAQETRPAGAETASGTIDPAQAGTAIPALTLGDPAGSTLETATLTGQPVLVNLWATWCAPCIKEMPLLDDLAGDYEGRLRVVTISQDMDGAAKVAPFFAERSFAHLEPWLDPDNTFGFALGGGNLPVTVLYDARGREVWRVAGDFDWAGEEARAAIDAAIAG